MPSASSPAARRSTISRLLIPIVALSALLLGMVSPAYAESTITGKVVADDTGAAIANANVNLESSYIEDGEVQWEYVAGTTTDDDGTFSMPGREAGTYRVTAEEPYLSLSRPTHLRGIGDSFTVGDVGQAKAPDTRLPLGGEVRGTVARADGGDGPFDVRLYRQFSDEDGDRWYTVTYDRVASPGPYAVKGLETGAYRIGFSDGGFPRAHVDQFWPAKTTVELAQSFTVTAGSITSGKDASLVKGGSIAGTVKADGPGDTRLANVTVTAFAQRVEAGVTRWVQVGQAFTGIDGRYTIGGLTTGSYHLRFNDAEFFPPTGRPAYDTEFYENAASQEQATAVAVTQGSSTSVRDASLGRRGSIRGTVSKEGGGALTTGRVNLYSYVESGDDYGYWRQTSSASTNSAGDYELADVVSGVHHLEFTDTAGKHVTEFFDDAVSNEDATPIVVTPGAPTTGRDATLAKSGSIAGVVTVPAGVDQEVCVSAYKRVAAAGSEQYERLYAAAKKTASDGTYVLTNLVPGRYKVRFDDCRTGTLLSQFWGGARKIADAQTIDLVGGAEVVGKNATMTQSATIEGSVTGARRGGADARVNVIDAATGKLVKATRVYGGAYSVTDLAAGSYQVEFARLSGMASSAAEFFKDTAEELGRIMAASVDLVAGETRSDVDASLVPGGHLKGRLVDGSGAPLGDYEVHAYTDDGTLVTRAGSTDANGQFDIGGLTTGSYKLVANLGKQGTAGRGYYVGAAQLSSTSTSATPIAVTIGASKVLSGNVVLGAPPVVSPPVVTPPIVGPPAPPAVRKVTPSVSVKIKGGKKKATLTVTVRARGVTPTGRVVVKLGSKKLKTVTLKNGRATIVLKKQTKGKKAYKVVYGGDSRVTNKTVTTPRVAIK